MNDNFDQLRNLNTDDSAVPLLHVLVVASDEVYQSVATAFGNEKLTITRHREGASAGDCKDHDCIDLIVIEYDETNIPDLHISPNGISTPLIVMIIESEQFKELTSFAGFQVYDQIKASSLVDGRTNQRILQHMIERKFLLKQLRHSKEAEERLGTILKHNVDAILVIDQETNAIRYANQSATVLFDHLGADLEGRVFGYPIASVDSPVVLDIFGTDGTTKIIEMRVSTINWEGNPAFLASFQDITDRTMAREELIQANAQLHLRFQDVANFNSALSHDLQTPLVSIKGYTKLAHEAVGNCDESLAYKYLNRIDRLASDADEIITGLLQLSQSTQIGSDLEMIDTGEVAKNVITELSTMIANQSAIVLVHSEMPLVQSKQSYIRQIFQNLIGNALKYGCGNAQPTIRVGSQIEDQEIKIYVQDNGVGIAPENQQRIFSAFVQGDTSSQGRGMGLAILSRLVVAHGGRAWVDSKQGEGATFWISFPKKTASVIVDIDSDKHGSN